MRPLDRVSSIKVKLSIVIVVAVAVSALVSSIGLRVGIPVWLRPFIAAVIALTLAYPFARGITSPLREMVKATQAMAAGDSTAPVTATSRDEVGELARSFNAMRSELDALDQQRRDLVANVSHELRTPISALQATLENIVDGVEPADPATLQLMLTQTQRLSRMIGQLLDLSRLEAGASPLHCRSFDLAPVLEQAISEVRLHDPSTEVIVSCPAGISLNADPERIHQVVANLVENAARHSPRDQSVEVSARTVDGAVLVDVVDHGPGIPVGEAHRVFERFYRADRARSSNDGGAGLGLAIVRWLVDLHGGDVFVDVSRRSGCCMTLVLPTGSEEVR